MAGRFRSRPGPRGHNAQMESRAARRCMPYRPHRRHGESVRSETGELPAWGPVRLAHHVALGTCVHDGQDLRQLYRRIEDYRHNAGTEALECGANVVKAMFRPPPDDRTLRARRLPFISEALPRGEHPQARGTSVEPCRDVNSCPWLIMPRPQRGRLLLLDMRKTSADLASSLQRNPARTA